MDVRSGTGYSGTALAKKLGIKTGSRVLLVEAPDGYEQLLAPLPPGVQFALSPNRNIDLVQLFVSQRDELAAQLEQLRKALDPDATLWVSWPKKASKIPATVTEDVIREVALPLGFVDVKVCAVSEIWSALKLVVRKTLR